MRWNSVVCSLTTKTRIKAVPGVADLAALLMSASCARKRERAFLLRQILLRPF